MKDKNKKNIKDSKLFIFDWSGTISDDRIPVQTAFNRVALDLGLSPIEDLKDWLRQSVKQFENEYSKQILGKKSPEEIRKMYSKHFSVLRNEGIKPTIYEDALDTLTQIKKKGKKLIVISSHPQKSLIEEADEYGLTKHFDKIIGNLVEKTDGIMQACKDYLIEAKDATYIGDMINDVRSAKKAKVISVALTRGYHDKKTLLLETPDYLLEKLADLMNLL